MTTNPPLDFLAAISEFEAAREALIAFRNKNAALLEQYDLLVAAHNSALKETKASFKKNYADMPRKYGDFSVTLKTEVDAKKLIELMPNAEGAVNIKYSIVREEYKKLVKANLIPEEVVQVIESFGGVSVYGPKEA